LYKLTTPQKIMKFRILIAVIYLIGVMACTKDKDNAIPVPPTPPAPTDTLNAWKKVKTADRYINDIWFTSTSKGFYLSGGSVMMTTNGGQSWSVVHANFDGVNLFFTDPLHGFAQGKKKFAITIDGGNTWTNKPIPNESLPFDIFFTSLSTGYYSTVNTGLHKTTDTGNTWTRLPYVNTTVTGIYFFDDNNGAVADLFLKKTKNGGLIWEDKGISIGGNPTLGAIYYSTMQFTGLNTGWYGSNAGVFKFIEGASQWSKVLSSGANSGSADIHFLDEKEGYYSIQKMIYKTTDGGNTWTISCKLAEENIAEIHFLDTNTGWACTDKGSILYLKL
jgi:photosystem II stability/assembly factor-like uncharacterized protein